ncbi:MAG: pyridoxamine 5'-phosphate oxidase family protein [Gammaproteobacteria bacterium]|nr:pyridoxamine 5'-phosphate oxidase family protein [Gammaproteobacteria bacterium]
MSDSTGGEYPVDDLNRVRRLAERGHYDRATIHGVLDAGVLAHVAYVVDGQPLCTPTFYWRDGWRLFWHGSNSSRMLRTLADGVPACLTVTHFDSLVLARSAFNHSADYRSVMAFGQARLVSDPLEKERALLRVVERMFPGRQPLLRPNAPQEIRATTVVSMDIERASAKIHAHGISDDEADYALPIYAERIPIRQVILEPESCPRLLAGVERPEHLRDFRAGASLEELLSTAARRLGGD